MRSQIDTVVIDTVFIDPTGPGNAPIRVGQ